MDKNQLTYNPKESRGGIIERQYTAVVVGCGSIGALKEDKYDYPGGGHVLTHAHALWDNPQVGEVWYIDENRLTSQKAAEKWGGTRINSMDTFSALKPDIIVIATPTDTHLEVFKEMIKRVPKINPKAIVVEKPFTNHLYEIEEVYRGQPTTNTFDTPIFVNYSRRYNPIYQQLVENLKDTKIYHCRIAYTRGFRHEACHAVDLCNWFFGKFIGGRLVHHDGNSGIIPLLTDHSSFDPSYAAWMSYEKCPYVFFCPSDGEAYSVFEIDIFTEKGRIRLVDSGQELQFTHPISEPTYGDYKMLPRTATEYWDTHLTKNLTYLYDNVIEVMEGKGKPLCGIEEAVKVHKVYDQMLIR